MRSTAQLAGAARAGHGIGSDHGRGADRAVRFGVDGAQDAEDILFGGSAEGVEVVFLAQGEDDGEIAGVIDPDRGQPNGAASRVGVDRLFDPAANTIVEGARCCRRGVADCAETPAAPGMPLKSVSVLESTAVISSSPRSGGA